MMRSSASTSSRYRRECCTALTSLVIVAAVASLYWHLSALQVNEAHDIEALRNSIESLHATTMSYKNTLAIPLVNSDHVLDALA